MKSNEKIKYKISLGIMSAIGGTVITLIIGFNWGGWVTGGTSLSMGKEMARDAVVERLAPICVSQFNMDPKRADNIVTFKEKNSWDQGRYIEIQGWATMPFENEPDREVASKCSELIAKES